MVSLVGHTQTSFGVDGGGLENKYHVLTEETDLKSHRESERERLTATAGRWLSASLEFLIHEFDLRSFVLRVSDLILLNGFSNFKHELSWTVIFV